MSCLYISYTRWFKYDRDCKRLVYTQIFRVIFEPPCNILPYIIYNYIILYYIILYYIILYYEGVSKSPSTMLITHKSLVVHEFSAGVCCGCVLWLSVPSGVVGCESVWLLLVFMCVLWTAQRGQPVGHKKCCRTLQYCQFIWLFVW
jgi:hypothetical protein